MKLILIGTVVAAIILAIVRTHHKTIITYEYTKNYFIFLFHRIKFNGRYQCGFSIVYQP